MTSTIDGIEYLTFITQLGPNINDPASKAFTSTLIPGGILAVTNEADKPMAGGLVTCKTFLPPALNTLDFPYFGLDLELCVSPSSLANLGRLELDVKRWTVGAPGPSSPLANIANESSQLNLQNGQWQIDGNPPGWRKTGFQPPMSPGWIPVSFRYHMDAEKFSFLSASWDRCRFEIPAAMQNVTLETSNWGPQAGCVIQLQTEVIEPGTVTVNFRNLKFLVGDTLIP